MYIHYDTNFTSSPVTLTWESAPGINAFRGQLPPTQVSSRNSFQVMLTAKAATV